MSDPVTQTSPALIGFDIVKHVTRAFYILPEDEPCFLRFQTPFTMDTTSFSERVRRRKETGEKAAPMQIADIVNLQTGEEMRLVAHQVLKNTMDETYPENTYVGKDFRIIKTQKKGGIGGKYFAFAIVEIRLKGAPVIEDDGQEELEFDSDLQYDKEHPDQGEDGEPDPMPGIGAGFRESIAAHGPLDPLPGTPADLDVPVILVAAMEQAADATTGASSPAASPTTKPPAWMSGSKPRPNGQDVRHTGSARKPQTAKTGRPGPRSK